MLEDEEEDTLTSTFKGSSMLMNVLLVLLGCLSLVLLIALIVLCSVSVLPRCPGFVKTLISKVERKLMFNSLLRALLETYLVSTITALVALQSPTQPYSNTERMDSLATVLTVGGALAFPVLQFRFLYSTYSRSRAEVDSEEFRARFDALFQNVEVSKGPRALSFTFFFLARRFFFAFTIVCVRITLPLQVLAVDFLSTCLLAYFLSVRPMRDRTNNFVQVFNEACVLAAE